MDEHKYQRLNGWMPDMERNDDSSVYKCYGCTQKQRIDMIHFLSVCEMTWKMNLNLNPALGRPFTSSQTQLGFLSHSSVPHLKLFFIPILTFIFYVPTEEVFHPIHHGTPFHTILYITSSYFIRFICQYLILLILFFYSYSLCQDCLALPCLALPFLLYPASEFFFFNFYFGWKMCGRWRGLCG